MDYRRNMGKVEKPWGYYEVVDNKPYCVIKELVVYPKQRLSLQSHQHRNEHWFILQGEGYMTIDNIGFDISVHDNIDIPRNIKHRIRNISEDTNLIISEIQTGEFFSESDIVRYEDDYSRE